MKQLNLLKWWIGVLVIALAFILSFGSFLMAQQKKPVAPAAPAKAVPEKPSKQEGLGIQEHEVGGVDVVLMEAKRTSGDTLTLKWQYRNKTQENKEIATGKGSWVDSYLFSYEAYLIDPVNKKKYLILKDEKGNPIAARHEGKKGISLAPGQTLTTWAKFPAPPTNVETISVYIPRVQPFEDISIGK